MIKQTRASRWLQVLETGRVLMSQSANSAEMYRANGRPLPLQAQNMMIGVSTDPIKMMIESNPPIEGTALAEQLNGVIQQAKSLTAGAGFHTGLTRLVEAVDEVLPVLRSTTDDEIDSATTLVGELERGFMLSLILSMSAHNAILQRVSDWEEEHTRFVQGRSRKDVGHYFSMHATNAEEIRNQSEHAFPVESSFYSDTPGPGKIHMQHMVHAINSGANVMVFGGGGMGSTEYYPEAMGIEYAQWFTYIHALWDEQFRPRFAALYNRGKDPEDKLQKNDIKSEFFNDIRKIRTDFVHHQGIVEDAANLEFFDWNFDAGSRLEVSMEQMIEVMDKFPRDQLLEEPKPQKQKRRSLRGSFDVNLLDKYLGHIDGSPTLGINQANDEMMRDWLVKKGLL
ncbi:hypothetical protein [Rhodococcus sp. MEB064]|uniref:hypothetical protein n=1 Tax=Rhodococcus sp. MEB064 TaxID=1587522 RepID=UPI0005AC33F9|nr:hypothetical protein [Rhodococcus sp. MEB064]KIQ20439.1 hypothetical protein RU01_02310 [Rhodococcus sp. MEB064]